MNIFKENRWILVLLVISIVIRFFIFFQIMNTTPFSDYFDYKQWVYKSYSQGFNKLYEINPKTHTTDINQPPGSMYILRGSYEVFLQTARVLTKTMHLKPGATLWINDNLLIFFLRFPSIIADIILGFLIYITVKTRANEKIALLASAFYLLSPPIIYNSTVWGQMDSINNLLFYLSLVFLVKKKTFPSVLFFGLSLFVKFSLLPLIPLYLLFALFGKFFKFKSLIISSLVTGSIILLLCLPVSTNPLWLINFALTASGGQSQTITVNAFNFWWLVLAPLLRMGTPDINTVMFGLKLGTWGNLIFTLFYIPIIFTGWNFIKNKKITTENVFFLATLTAFITFLFLPKMHERYLYPTLPLLITWVGFKNKYWIHTAVLSLIHFLNLYLVWNPVFIFGIFGPSSESVIRSQTFDWTLSLLTIVIFGFFYIKMYPKINGKIGRLGK